MSHHEQHTDSEQRHLDSVNEALRVQIPDLRRAESLGQSSPDQQTSSPVAAPSATKKRKLNAYKDQHEAQPHRNKRQGTRMRKNKIPASLMYSQEHLEQVQRDLFAQRFSPPDPPNPIYSYTFPQVNISSTSAFTHESAQATSSQGHESTFNMATHALVAEFILPPQQIFRQEALHKSTFDFQPQIKSGQRARSDTGGQLLVDAENAPISYLLKCVPELTLQTSSLDLDLSYDRWRDTQCRWPIGLYVLLNEQYCQPLKSSSRYAAHHSIDVSAFIKPGENVLLVSFNNLSRDEGTFRIALESRASPQGKDVATS